MCGRYATTADPALLAVELDAIDETDPNEELLPEEAGPNYNVAPTTKVLTVVSRHAPDQPHDAPRRRIRRMRWGLVPHWTKAAEPGVPVTGKPLFNARAETAATTTSFRDALRARRCLVPMDGWYEWLTEPGPGRKVTKVPFFTTAPDRLYAAGLWSVWRDPAARARPPLLSCTILTTDAVGDLRNIHERMPLILPEPAWDAWLDPDRRAPDGILQPPAADRVAALEIRPVSAAVNSIRNNSADLLDRIDPAAGQLTLH